MDETGQKQFGIYKEGFIDIRLTRQDIASYAGTTYETIFRVMTELKKARIIKVSEKISLSLMRKNGSN